MITPMITKVLESMSASKIEDSIYGSSEGKKTLRVAIDRFDDERHYVAAARDVSWFKKFLYVKMQDKEGKTIFVNKSSLKKRFCSSESDLTELNTLQKILPTIASTDSLFATELLTKKVHVCQKAGLLSPKEISDMEIFLYDLIEHRSNKIIFRFGPNRYMIGKPNDPEAPRYIIMSDPENDIFIDEKDSRKLCFAIEADTYARKVVVMWHDDRLLDINQFKNQTFSVTHGDIIISDKSPKVYVKKHYPKITKFAILDIDDPLDKTT